jgi:hypothetical protein
MVLVELNNTYINIGANNGSEKLWTEKIIAITYNFLSTIYNRLFYLRHGLDSFNTYLLQTILPI